MLSLREGKMPQIVRFVLQSCTFRFRDYTGENFLCMLYSYFLYA